MSQPDTPARDPQVVPSVSEATIHAAIRQQDRLQDIADLGLASADTDEILQEICTQAAQALALPIGLVTVVLDEAQYFAARYGLDGWMEAARGTPVEWAYCRFSVATGEAFVVQDATTHPLVQDNPLFTADGLRCYAGIPLISSRGFALGSLCVAGTEAREFSPADLDQLRGFAAAAIARIESRRRSGTGPQ
ncbi:MAG: GAF domain-containing protein [Gemmatimonadota bacterium]|nr:GAF domain-containing protein [Gemmatimonadota bacterium]MDQ8167855.1 GAF domain-containing protein [Gemmatimonadota bacterium]MDQ8172546.1 GAF domain-containing protein [Gemmatimonadota bacterium]